MNPTDRKRGHYLGTEIDEKWWRRFRESGFFARGMGEYWIEDGTLYFRRYLIKAPVVIPLRHVTEIKLGRWHAGRWAGRAPVVKILWKPADELLSSGFVFSRDTLETIALVESLRAAVARSTAGGA